jgi:hypothetical protein
MVYTLKCLPPWIILGYALLLWGVNVTYPNPGKERTDPVAATTFLIGNIFFLTLDACDSPRRFQLVAFTLMFMSLVFAAAMASFVWRDVVILDGTETDAGWAGRLTKNGLQRISYAGMLSMTTSALVVSLFDRDHGQCYFLTDFMFKSDLFADDQ